MNATHDDDAFDAPHPLPPGGPAASTDAAPADAATDEPSSSKLDFPEPGTAQPEPSWHARLQASAGAPAGDSPPPTALASALIAALSGTPARVSGPSSSPPGGGPGGETLARVAAAADIVMRRASGAPPAATPPAAGFSARPGARPILRAGPAPLRLPAGAAPPAARDAYAQARMHGPATAGTNAAPDADTGTGIDEATGHPAETTDDPHDPRADPGHVADTRRSLDDDDGGKPSPAHDLDDAGPDDRQRPAMDAERPARTVPSHAAVGDALLAGLGRRFRGATIQIEFELRTTAVRQVFRRDFVYVSQQAHALESSRRVQGIDRQRLAEALRLVERRGESIRATLQDAIVQARELVRRAGEAPQDVRFTRAAALQATIVSPYARLFVDLMRLADEAISLLEGAWLMGALDSAERAELINECRRVLVSYKDIVRDQRHAIGEHVRAVNEERRRARGYEGLRRHDPPQHPHAGTLRRHGPRSWPGSGSATASQAMPESASGSPLRFGDTGRPADDESFADAP